MGSSNPGECPYKNLTDSFYWKDSLVDRPIEDVDPVLNSKFKITKKMRIATAGSCFAQHLSKHIKSQGYHYYTPESAPGIFSEEVAQRYNYGIFSCRYGNIYTSKQLVQTFDRAFGDLIYDDHWQENDRFYDPLRPFINPNGFSSLDDLRMDRSYHLSKVKEMFENLTIFIFTLGLTESWIEFKNDVVYPVCPGCRVGRFDEQRYRFHNESIFDVINNLQSFNRKLCRVNPTAKIILTVSPVPLIATMENKHVLTANTYSKSTLRVAAHELEKENANVAYFPSYEIITGSYNRGSYFSSDLRTITPEGIQHVMKVFSKHYTEEEQTKHTESVSGIGYIKKLFSKQVNKDGSAKSPMVAIDSVVTVSDIDVVCDEEIMFK